MKSLFKFLRRNAGLIALTVVVAYLVFLWVYSSVEGLENDVHDQTFVWAQIVLNGANGVSIASDDNLTVGNKVEDDEWKEQGFQSEFMALTEDPETNTFIRNTLTKEIYNKFTDAEMALFTEDLSRLSATSNSGTGQTMDGYLALAKTENKTHINGVPIGTMVTSDKVEDIEAKKAAKEAKEAAEETPSE